jgi:hypothetical protein
MRGSRMDLRMSVLVCFLVHRVKTDNLHGDGDKNEKFDQNLLPFRGGYFSVSSRFILLARKYTFVLR